MLNPAPNKIGRHLDIHRGEHALALRDRAMIELLYAGGVRVSEVADAPSRRSEAGGGIHSGRGKGDKETHGGRLGVPAQHAYSITSKMAGKHGQETKVAASVSGAGGRRLNPSAPLAAGRQASLSSGRHASPTLRPLLRDPHVENGAICAPSRPSSDMPNFDDTGLHHVALDRLKSVYRSTHPRAKARNKCDRRL